MLILRIGIGNLFTAVLTIDKVFDHSGLEWAGSKQGYQCDDVLKTIRPQVLNQFLHAPAFQLEYGRCLSALQQVVNLIVIERYLVDIYWRLNIRALINHRHCPIDDGQRPEAQEVKFDKTRILNIILVVLCNKALPFLIAEQGREVGQFRGCDHHAASMLTGISGQPLELDRHIPNLLSGTILL